MIERHLGYYLGSKLIAAVINLVAMALMVRIAGPETYGAYLLILAVAVIVYALSMQWLRFAFFACFRAESASALVVTYMAALGIGFAVTAIAAGALAGLDLVTWDVAAGVGALVVGLASYDALHEMARTRLEARAVAIGVLTRAFLLPTLGVGALLVHATPLALAIGVSLAHLGAAVPLLLNVAPEIRGAPSRAQAGRLWAYGRPLVPAFGLDSLGNNLDRLLLARFAGFADLGPYGAVADLVRQVMIVAAEAISGAYMSIARAAAVEGRHDEAGAVLGRAFLAYVAFTAFAALAILRFDRLVIDTMFGAGVGAAVEPVLALIVATGVVIVFRGYFFGQALYLMESSHMLLVSNGVHTATVAITGLLLVPVHGIPGAAAALLAGSVAGTLVYVYAWRNHYVLDLPYVEAAQILLLAGAAFLVSGIVERMSGPSVLAASVNILVFASLALVAARRFDILSFNSLAGVAWRTVSARGRSQ
jgi:O-antigen/teichoic acid export membrane protein